MANATETPTATAIDPLYHYSFIAWILSCLLWKFLVEAAGIWALLTPLFCQYIQSTVYPMPFIIGKQCLHLITRTKVIIFKFCKVEMILHSNTRYANTIEKLWLLMLTRNPFQMKLKITDEWWIYGYSIGLRTRAYSLVGYKIVAALINQ